MRTRLARSLAPLDLSVYREGGLKPLSSHPSFYTCPGLSSVCHLQDRLPKKRQEVGYESSVHSRSPHQENNWDWGPVRMILGFLPQADGAWCQGVKPGTSPQWVAAPSNLTACPAAQEKSGALGTPNSLLMRSGGVTRSLIYLYGEPPL